MIINETNTFLVEYFEDMPAEYPGGYFIASTDDYEGIGATETDAMSVLINTLVRSINALETR